MSDSKLSFVAQVKSYPGVFWCANTMEIFERMAWYGWFTVMALYVTGSPETGGLGFTTETRGTLQAIIPCLLYLMPVVTGAIADQFGYKKLFIIAYSIMIAAYFALGQFHELHTFTIAFFCVAIGAAIFKPIIVGTISRVTNDTNSSMAFGIFYMMVNIGGFVGPFVAGAVRGWGWEWVFIACSSWAAVNLVIVLVFYREPEVATRNEEKRTIVQAFGKAFENLVVVLGNLRFFLTVGVVIVGLMVASTLDSIGISWFSWWYCGVGLVGWVVINFMYDALLPAGSGKPEESGAAKRFPLFKRMHCSDWRFAIFLLIMSGFWTSFNQIFYTMPEYIRDYTNTRPLIDFAEATVDADPTGLLPMIFGENDSTDPNAGVASAIATISDKERDQIELRIEKLIAGGGEKDAALYPEIAKELLDTKIRIAPEVLTSLVAESGATTASVTDRVIIMGRQVNPEFIVNFDAGAIIAFQVLISFLMTRFHQFTTMIVGMVIAAIGIGLSGFAGDTGLLGNGGCIWIVGAGIIIFAFGEMMASPTSQAYISRIAPKEKAALYMGYYFVSVALGNLFGGILSGQLMGKLVRDMNRPDLMWYTFGGIMMGTAIVFLIYNRVALPKSQPQTA